MPASVILVLCLGAALVALFVGFRIHLTRSREGKMLAFVALFALPVMAAWGGFSEQMERAESTKFCLSCHVMEGFGKSLHRDDPSYIPAAHFQNIRVPRERACYTCHTNYTMFGTVTAKMEGLRHLWVQYAGTIPAPEAIRPYEPYNNRECLHCHLGARSFEQGSTHNKDPERLSLIKSNKLSCVSSGCHEFVHDIASLKDASFWKENP
jgi:nitrate/TMAO reductase-like tetraheme cytochrome c subunit